MTSRDPKGAVRQYGRLSQRQLGFLLSVYFDICKHDYTATHCYTMISSLLHKQQNTRRENTHEIHIKHVKVVNQLNKLLLFPVF